MDLIEHPLDFINTCFQNEYESLLSSTSKQQLKDNKQQDGNVDIKRLLSKSSLGLKEKFQFALDKEGYETIPWLTKKGIFTGKLKSGMLVRYRGMVQDIFDPEYYDGMVEGTVKGTESKVLLSSKYQDVFVQPPNITVQDIDKDGYLLERLPIYCVPVPGESEWVREQYVSNKALKSISKPAKFTKAAVVVEEEDVKNKKKKQINDNNMVDDDEKENSMQNKKICNESSSNNMMETEEKVVKIMEKKKNPTSADELRLSTPIPTTEQNEVLQPCIVKLYDEWEQCQVNDMIDFVGVLALSTPGAAGQDEENKLIDEFSQMEVSARQPPAHLVPRIHCIVYKKDPKPNMLQMMDDSSKIVLPTIREKVLDFITNYVFNGKDRLAAEYLLLWMASGVFERIQVQEILVGKFTLGFTNISNPKIIEKIFNVVEMLLPRVQKLDLDIEQLNKNSIAPKKCHQANRLRSGRLQTCNKTPIVIDESKLSTGELNEIGLKNLQALQQVAEKQTVTYDFGYFQKEWSVDLPVLVVCETKKPFVQGTDCLVQITITSNDDEKPKLSTTTTEKDIKLFRQYFHSLRCKSKNQFEIDEDLCEKIQQDFVQDRKKDPTNTSQQTLNLKLNIARLYEKTKASNKLTKEGYERIKQMEIERLERAK